MPTQRKRRLTQAWDTFGLDRGKKTRPSIVLCKKHKRKVAELLRKGAPEIPFRDNPGMVETRTGLRPAMIDDDHRAPLDKATRRTRWEAILASGACDCRKCKALTAKKADKEHARRNPKSTGGVQVVNGVRSKKDRETQKERIAAARARLDEILVEIGHRRDAGARRRVNDQRRIINALIRGEAVPEKKAKAAPKKRDAGFKLVRRKRQTVVQEVKQVWIYTDIVPVEDDFSVDEHARAIKIPGEYATASEAFRSEAFKSLNITRGKSVKVLPASAFVS